MSQDPEEEEEEDHLLEKMPERPLDCTECKKSVSVFYSLIVGEHLTQTCMCSDCPELQKRLHGSPSWKTGGEGQENITGLACGNCGTTLDAIRMGSNLGCCDCYEVFEDIVIQELLSSGKIPGRLTATNKKAAPVHIGRGPGELQEVNISSRLLALSEALNETLKKEDYEQAAWLRDQIRALTERREEKDEQ